MPESYVYIDAPSLDNADQSKFIVNRDFQYVQAGDSSKGDVAQFPLYEKFLNTEWNTSLSFNSLSRTSFKNGQWAEKSDGDVENGGDYGKGNVVQVYSKIFQVGQLLKLRFRFFDKNFINIENRNTSNVIPQITDYNATVPRVAIFETVLKNDGTVNKDKYKFLSYANFESQDADGGIYAVEDDIRISGRSLTLLNFSYAFVFVTSEGNWTEYIKDTEYNFSTLRTVATAEERRIGFRSVPRGSLDNRSYICGDGTTDRGISSGQNRLLDFDFYIDIDLIDEYIGDNSSNHHLDMTDIVELNKLRYSAPPMPSSANFIRKATAAGYASSSDADSNYAIYLSDYSLSRGNAISLVDKTISSIQIPFQYTTNQNDYENGSFNKFDALNGGILHTNRQLYIALGKEDGSLPNANEWICSDNIVAFSYFHDEMIYQFTYNNGKGIKYNGHGLYFRARRPIEDASGLNTFPVHYYENASTGSRYAISPSDKIISTVTTAGFNATANIDVLFDYKTRKEWFDYIESNIGIGGGGIGGGTTTIEGNAISLGNWRIAVNADGNLEVYHINATSIADRNIFYKPTSN